MMTRHRCILAAFSVRNNKPNFGYVYLLSGMALSDVFAIVTASGHNTRSKEFVP
jgi:hypothetical protein